MATTPVDTGAQMGSPEMATAQLSNIGQIEAIKNSVSLAGWGVEGSDIQLGTWELFRSWVANWDASGWNGNLDSGDTSFQEVFDKLNALVTGTDLFDTVANKNARPTPGKNTSGEDVQAGYKVQCQSNRIVYQLNDAETAYFILEESLDVTLANAADFITISEPEPHQTIYIHGEDVNDLAHTYRRNSNNTAWVEVSGAGGTSGGGVAQVWSEERFVLDGITIPGGITLVGTPTGTEQCFVQLKDGPLLRPTDDYTLSGQLITFSAAWQAVLKSGHEVSVRFLV